MSRLYLLMEKYLFLLDRTPKPQKIERRRYRTEQPHGSFPPGTECWAERARPDAMLVLEVDDGSVIEIAPWQGFMPEELPIRLTDIVSIIIYSYFETKKFYQERL